jgi:hypothetical protein
MPKIVADIRTNMEIEITDLTPKLGHIILNPILDNMETKIADRLMFLIMAFDHSNTRWSGIKHFKKVE